MLIKGEPFVKRVSMPLEFRRDITLYGKSNLYPQMVEQVMFRSSTSMSAITSLADFTKAEGFENNGDVIVNRHEQSINEILAIQSFDYSKYNGFALHFNVNELMQITEITPVDFKNVRFGLPDEDGIHNDVKINSNWENDPMKTLRKEERLFKFPIWQQRENIIDFDIDESNGFILYWTPEPDQYPKSTLDPVLDSAQTDAEIQMFELGNIQNGFLGASIFKNPNKIEGEKERRQLEEDLRGLQGSSNANSIMVVDTPPDFEQSLIENIAANNNDRLFELTQQNVVQRIMTNYSQPFPIAGIQPPNGGIFNQEQMKDATIYYNAKTRNRRIIISDIFNRFMQFWEGGATDLGSITEMQFDEEQEEVAPDVNEGNE